MDKTWVKLYRKIINSEVFLDEKAFQLLVWLLVSVDYQSGSIKVGRFWLADKLRSNPNTIKDVIKRLEKKYKIITTSHTNRFTEITLLNWAKYQSRIFPTPQDDTNKTPSGHHQDTTNQEYKNIRNKEKNAILEDSNFQKLIGLKGSTDSEMRLKMALEYSLENKYPAWKYKEQWDEATKYKRSILN